MIGYEPLVHFGSMPEHNYGRLTAVRRVLIIGKPISAYEFASNDIFPIQFLLCRVGSKIPLRLIKQVWDDKEIATGVDSTSYPLDYHCMQAHVLYTRPLQPAAVCSIH